MKKSQITVPGSCSANPRLMPPDPGKQPQLRIFYDSGEVQLKASDTGGSDQNRDQYLKDITAEDNNREAELTPLSKRRKKRI